jgi:ABC-type transport system involved in multi-copper enzyme maturation permease subunit
MEARFSIFCFPPKFKRTGSAYILVSFFLFYLFVCVFVQFCFPILYLARNKNRLCKGWENRIVQKHTQINKIKKKKKYLTYTKITDWWSG